MIARLPWWGWLGAVTVGLYALYNPGGRSLYHMWAEGWPMWLSAKVLLTFAVLAMLGVVCTATWRSIGVVGCAVLALLIAAVLWLLTDLGLSRRLAEAAGWLAQPLVAVVVTVGLRWSRVWFAITGRRAADTYATDESHHHDATHP